MGAQLRSSPSPTYSVAFQGGAGRLVASVEGNASFHNFSSDNSLILWDVEAEVGGEMLARLAGHKRRVNCCAFSGAGSLIVTGANDNSVRLWMLSPALQAWGPGEEGRARRSHQGGQEGGQEGGAVDAGAVHLYFGGRDSGSEAGSTTASNSASVSAIGRGRTEGEEDFEIEVESELGGGGVFGARASSSHGGRLPAEASSSSSSCSKSASPSLPADRADGADRTDSELHERHRHQPPLHALAPPSHDGSDQHDAAASAVERDDGEAASDGRGGGGCGGGGQVGGGGGEAEWVQVRTPFRVEARILGRFAGVFTRSLLPACLFLLFCLRDITRGAGSQCQTPPSTPTAAP